MSRKRKPPPGKGARKRSWEEGNYSVICPTCGDGPVTVKDSRPAGGKIEAHRRRRLCTRCGYRWTTYEISDAVFRKILYDLADTLARDVADLRWKFANAHLADILGARRTPDDPTSPPPGPRLTHPRTQEDRQ